MSNGILTLRLALVCGLAAAVCAPALAGPGSTFVNWESPHVHPLDRLGTERYLLVVNTADDRLEVFDLLGTGGNQLVASVPVGLDPISVRARTATEAWVVNHISDSVSIVNLTTKNVIATLSTQDEPCDVVFAGTPQKAFVSCAGTNAVMVFDTANPTGVAPVVIPIEGREPRALAVSADGSTVYAAVFMSGNRTTVLNGGNPLAPASGGTLGIPQVVNNPAGPHGGVNPPPNNGVDFNPPLNPMNQAIPVGLIVRQDATGNWLDDTGADWTNFVSGANSTASGRVAGWTLVDQDAAIIDAATLSVSAYADGLMNACLGIAVNPASGAVTIVGTDATNEVRYEPIVKGKFVHDIFASFPPATPASVTLTDLNPHLLPSPPANPPPEFRLQSIGDPRAIAWRSDGASGFVVGLGSNNLLHVDAAGQRIGDPIVVGEGPTGLVVAEDRNVMYVLNRFAATVTVIRLDMLTQVGSFSFYDPTPSAIRVGRKHLYDTHKNSQNGQVSCASCHIDGQMDGLAWDLGNPAGAIDSNGLVDQNLGANMPLLSPGNLDPSFPPFDNWSEMKGPMLTQTMQDIIGNEPLHFRGDRDGIESFSGAFIGLLGNDVTLTATEMQEFKNFLATITYPPNPFRNFDNTLPTSVPLTGHYATGQFALAAGTQLPNGNASSGLNLFRNVASICDTHFSCVQCHTLPTGMGTDNAWNGLSFVPIALGPNGEHHRSLITAEFQTNFTTKTPQLRNLYKRVGCNFTRQRSLAGFGYMHDGTVDSIERFVGLSNFLITIDGQIANLTAFMLCFSGSDLPAGSPTALNNPPGGTSKDSHAAVGRQTTLVSAASPLPGQLALITSMTSLAEANKVGLVVKGIFGGQRRGFAYIGGGNFQSDKLAEVYTSEQLQAAAAPGAELTYTVVPKGTETRIGLDRDQDGTFDGDEVVCSVDINGNGVADIGDIFGFITQWFQHTPLADWNHNQVYDIGDIFAFLSTWFLGCH